MKKILFIICFPIVLFSCNQKDEKFCECLSVSEDFNTINQKILNGQTNQKTLEKALLLKKEKQQKCADYVNMDGNTMLTKKKDCK